MVAPVVQRIAKGAPATLTLTVTDSDGEPAEPAGTVTVGVAKADGTAVVAALTATAAGSTGVRTVALTSAQTATLERLTATWTNGTATWVSYAEIVGGFLFSVAQARAFDASLSVSASNPFSTAEILAARGVVEQRCEFICDRAFVPRYARVTLDGGGGPELVLGVSEPRSIRSVRVLSVAGSTTYTTLSASALAGIARFEDGTIRRTDGGVWAEDRQNIVVEVEHGWDTPPPDLVPAVLLHLRHHLTSSRTPLLDRATQFNDGDGGSYQLATADVYKVGIPPVDAIYEQYSRRSRGTAKVPASRPLVWQSQRSSLFHRQ